jgi:hypothetical protein
MHVGISHRCMDTASKLEIECSKFLLTSLSAALTDRDICTWGGIYSISRRCAHI